MALSFGRGKKGNTDNTVPDAASNAADKMPSGNVPAGNATAGNATNGASEEVLDESWFESAFNEEAANPSRPGPPRVNVAPNAAYPAQQPATPPDDFSIFAELEESPKAPATPSFDTSSFDMSDVPATAPSAATSSSPFEKIESTPFDATTIANSSSEAPARTQGGGLKKLLPVIGLLVVVGGGALFWQSQMNDGFEEDEPVIPVATAPAPDTPPASQAPAATTPPGGSQAPAAATPDPKVKAQLKNLWNDGLKARKAGKNAEARKKWQEAVKLARSKPGFNQSAEQIQQAINKLQ